MAKFVNIDKQRAPDVIRISLAETTARPSTGAMHAKLGFASSPTVTMSLELGVRRRSCCLLSAPTVSRHPQAIPELLLIISGRPKGFGTIRSHLRFYLTTRLLRMTEL
jgi:hypothetical protein